MADYTDVRYPSIRLGSLQTVLPGISALALCAPADGIARPVTASDFNMPSPPLPAAALASALKIARNPGARMEGRGKQPPALPAIQPGPIANDGQIFNHVDVGGRFTICILFWGPDQYYDLHRRCLEAIVSTVPLPRMDLRVGSNELNQRSLSMLRDYVDRGVITKHYRHDTNALKYPVMREMFHDPGCPITTKWVIWFDDDSIADRTAQWLTMLAQGIVQHHRRDNVHMFGAKCHTKLLPGQREWYESRPWYRKKPWRASNGKPVPNGDRILFVAGGWWAITHEAIVNCDIPDPGLRHNGGDILIGEQIYQGGYELKQWNAKKQIINTSSVKRRGVSQPHPGVTR